MSERRAVAAFVLGEAGLAAHEAAVDAANAEAAANAPRRLTEAEREPRVFDGPSGGSFEVEVVGWSVADVRYVTWWAGPWYRDGDLAPDPLTGVVGADGSVDGDVVFPDRVRAAEHRTLRGAVGWVSRHGGLVDEGEAS